MNKLYKFTPEEINTSYYLYGDDYLDLLKDKFYVTLNSECTHRVLRRTCSECSPGKGSLGRKGRINKILPDTNRVYVWFENSTALWVSPHELTFWEISDE